MTTTLITGANTGIGLAAARQLAAQGHQVVLTSRNQQRGQDAVAQIRRRQPDADVHLARLDLASFDDVRKSAEDIAQRFPQIDALICNAGLSLSERTITADGIETMLQTNHFGHHLFTSILLPHILPSADARIVVVSSTVHRQAPISPSTTSPSNIPKAPSTATARPNSPTSGSPANSTDATPPHGLATFSVHPGLIRSDFGRDGDMRGPRRHLPAPAPPLLPLRRQRRIAPGPPRR